jgi:hypothetical protein
MRLAVSKIQRCTSRPLFKPAFMHHAFHEKPTGVRSGDSSGQVHCHVSIELCGATSRCKDICNRVLCRSRHMNDAYFPCQVQLNFKHP